MKSLKNLVVPFIILIALVICAIVYFAVENFKNREPSETSSELINVVNFTVQDVSSLSVKNNVTGYNSVVNCVSDANGGITYSYVGDEANSSENYSQARLSNYVGSLSSFSCDSKVSTEGNYAEYGLDNPRYTITINGKDGNNTTLYLGNVSPDGKFVYMYVAGSKDIYSVSVVKSATAENTEVNFVDSQKLSIDYSEVNSVRFSRQTDGLSLEADVKVDEKGIATFNITKPYVHPSSTYFAHMFDIITNLEINEFVNISQQDLTTYGLATPTYEFIINMKNGSKTEIYLSKLINGYYYGRISGMKRYFMLSEYQVEGLDLQETILIEPYICYCYAKDYSTISGKYGDKSFKFELDVPAGTAIMDKETTVKLDGRNAKIEDSFGRSYCSLLFESIACIKIGGVEMDAKVNKSAGPVITLTFIDRNYVTTEYEFYTRDSDSYYVCKNGEYMNFYVYSREIFNDGGSDTYNYGFWKAYELLNEAISGNSNGIYDISKET